MPERNRTQRRLDHVHKTYGHAPGVIGATMAILNMGIIRGSFHTSPENRPEVDAFFLEGLDQIRDLGPGVNRHIPWIGREVNREIKRRTKIDAARGPAGPGVVWWPRRWRNIRDWFAHASPNTAQLSWIEADIQATAWHTEMERSNAPVPGVIPQGPVLVDLGGGWTAQDLNTLELLAAEGAAMKHCIEDYWGAVEKGNTQIVSIRDPRGKPHVTIELDLWGDRAGSPSVAQIQGGANSTPKSKYHPYIEATIKALVPQTQWTMEVEQYFEGGREVLWTLAIQNEGAFEEYASIFEDEPGISEIEQLLAGWEQWIQNSGESHGATQIFDSDYINAAIDEGKITLSARVSHKQFNPMSDRAYESFLDAAHSDPSIRAHLEDPDKEDGVNDAWEAGTQIAWKRFVESLMEEVHTHSFGDDGDLTVNWVVPMKDRKKSLGYFVPQEAPFGRGHDPSAAQQAVQDATRLINSEYVSWANGMTEEALNALMDKISG